MTSTTLLSQIASLRASLMQHHDIVDVGAANEHPTQGPNWAMRATSLIDEAEVEIRKGLAKRGADECPDDGNRLADDGVCGFCGNKPDALVARIAKDVRS